MQEKIDGFRGAFVDLAADYVKRVAVRAAQQEPEAKGAAQQFRYELANDIQIANTLAETIEKMQKDSAGELPRESTEKEQPARPEPVTLGPGVSFRLEKTQVSGPCSMEDSTSAEALFTLKDLCGYCRMLAKNKWAIQTEREWDADVAALEFAISVLSELREIKEVRIPAEPNTPGVWELMRDILAGKRPAPEGTVFDEEVAASVWPEAGKTT